MTTTDTLEHYAEICEAMHQIILVENRCLKSSGTPPDSGSLQAKRGKLAELSAALAMVQAEIFTRPTGEIRTAAAKAQQIILKTLLVDRENEKLLLKAISTPTLSKTAARPPAAHFQRAYSHTS